MTGPDGIFFSYDDKIEFCKLAQTQFVILPSSNIQPIFRAQDT